MQREAMCIFVYTAIIPFKEQRQLEMLFATIYSRIRAIATLLCELRELGVWPNTLGSEPILLYLQERSVTVYCISCGPETLESTLRFFMV